MSFTKIRMLTQGIDHSSSNQKLWLPKNKYITRETLVLETGLSKEFRKPLSEMTGLRARLSPLLQLIGTMAEKESVDAENKATYEIQLQANNVKDRKRAAICQDLTTISQILETIPSIDETQFPIDVILVEG